MSVDPAALVAALEAEGWRVVGQRSGEYGHKRLRRDPDNWLEPSLSVPNSADDGDADVAAVLRDLELRAELGARAAAVLARLDGGAP